MDLQDLKNIGFVTLSANSQGKSGDYRIFQEYNFTPASNVFVKSLSSKVQFAWDAPAACFLVIGEYGRAMSNDFTDYEYLYSFDAHPVYNELSAVYSQKLSQPFYAQEFIRLVKHSRKTP